MVNNQDLLNSLYKLEIIKPPSLLKNSSFNSQSTFDLKKLYEHPNCLDQIINKLCEMIRSLEFDIICSTPEKSLGLASLICHKLSKPLVFVCSENPLRWGMNFNIEGAYKPNSKALIIDDILYDDNSISRIVEILKEKKIGVVQALSLVDNRTQYSRPEKNNEKLFQFLFKTHEILQIHNPLFISLKQRILKKKVPICFEPLATHMNDLFDVVEKFSDYISIVKFSSDLIVDANCENLCELKASAAEKNIYLLESKPFCDSGSRMVEQFLLGKMQIHKWADIIQAHPLVGLTALQKLSTVMSNTQGLILIAQLPYERNLIDDLYTQSTLGIANGLKTKVLGLACQTLLNTTDYFQFFQHSFEKSEIVIHNFHLDLIKPQQIPKIFTVRQNSFDSEFIKMQLVDLSAKYDQQKFQIKNIIPQIFSKHESKVGSIHF